MNYLDFTKFSNIGEPHFAIYRYFIKKISKNRKIFRFFISTLSGENIVIFTKIGIDRVLFSKILRIHALSC
ncbi:hypothetical protein CH369_10010 [Leptospira levettii]|nr:hypothetical protein CH369_10010 [Leptospira levettii]